MKQGDTLVKCEGCGKMVKSSVFWGGLCGACAEADSVISFGEGYNCKGECKADSCKLHNKSDKCLLTFSGWCKECLCVYGCNL